MTEAEEHALLASLSELKESVAEIRKILDAIAHGATEEVLHKRSQYLDMLIQREAERAALRKAIIEKTLVTLIWLFVAFIGVSTFEYVKSAIHDERKEWQ